MSHEIEINRTEVDKNGLLLDADGCVVETDGTTGEQWNTGLTPKEYLSAPEKMNRR